MIFACDSISAWERQWKIEGDVQSQRGNREHSSVTVIDNQDLSASYSTREDPKSFCADYNW